MTAQKPYRLPTPITPERYEIRLTPDLANWTFTGEERVSVEVHEFSREIILNAAELEIHAVSLTTPDGTVLQCKVKLDSQNELAQLSFAETVPVDRCELNIQFSGILNDKLHGFYRSTYKDAKGQEKALASTQFESTDARRAFPCWDEPAFKAVFQVTLVVDEKLTAISNARVLRETVLPGTGKKEVVFADTMKMSTYLVAFIVGDFEATEPVMVGHAPLRVWAVPGKKHLAKFAIDIGKVSLEHFSRYYDIPYPGDKLDLIAIPDFASGAMENLGAITFRETALLVDAARATRAELERVADVVAHENAHMWFGDLVTMKWWNGIWLNEAFATFMEMLAVDAWKPEWQRWTTFGVSRAAALSVDGLHSTRPIEFHVEAPRDADAMFDVLTYEKGASVLRMLEQHLGPALFRDGVREYLRRHAYANADTGDLWAALGRAARQPIPAVMDGWIFQPGYPLVSARLEGGHLVLRQQRFTYLPEPLPGSMPTAQDQLWQVPVQVRITAAGRSASERRLLAGAETRLPVPERVDAVLVNEGGHGFYRVRYSGELLGHLLDALPEIAAIERFNVVNDAWAVTVAGLMALPDYLELTARFRDERDRNVWAVLLASFATLNRIVEPRHRPQLAALVRGRAARAFAALGWTVRPGDDELMRQLRGDLLRALGMLGDDPDVQARTAELYAGTA